MTFMSKGMTMEVFDGWMYSTSLREDNQVNSINTRHEGCFLKFVFMYI